MDTRTVVAFGLILVLMASFYTLVYHEDEEVLPVVTTQPLEESGTATYVCQNNQTISARFFEQVPPPETLPGEPPQPNGEVHLIFNQGTTTVLKQTISANGVRYANEDDSFVFWNKGNSALVLENGESSQYEGCLIVSEGEVVAGLPLTYLDPESRFTLRLPSPETIGGSFTINPEVNRETASGTISGVSFTVPEAMATGTTLSADSGFSIEQVSLESCNPSQFLSMEASSSVLIDRGTEYLVASTSDAGAGNRYEEIAYTIPGTIPCTAIRYFIHSTVMENYPEGTITAFDREQVIALFDQIRRTLILGQ